VHPPLGCPGGLNVQGIEARVADHPNAGRSPPSGVIRSRASPATYSREELKNPAMRSYNPRR
jgi:hypothetical protein